MIFALSTGSITEFGVSAVAHSLLIAGVVGTVATFETARAQPNRFISLSRGMNGETERLRPLSLSRSSNVSSKITSHLLNGNC